MLGQRGVDHLVLAVHDLEAARSVYQSLGFTVTPVAHHPFGTSNALVQYQHGFLELLAVTDPDRFTPATSRVFSFGEFNQRYLDRREGCSMLVYQTKDARADCDAFIAAGLRTYDPFDFGRLATLPDGSQVNVSFSLALVEHPPSADNAMFFCCQQHAPEHFWKPDYQQHANGAVDIGDVYGLTRDLTSMRTYFSSLHGDDSVEEKEGVLECRTGTNRVLIFNQTTHLARFGDSHMQAPATGMLFTGFSVRTQDWSALATTLQSLDGSQYGINLQTADSSHGDLGVAQLTGVYGANLVFENTL